MYYMIKSPYHSVYHIILEMFKNDTGEKSMIITFVI